MTDYGPLLYRNLGFSTTNALIIQAGWITFGIFGNFLNAVLLDRVGRKWLMSTVSLHSTEFICSTDDEQCTAGGMVGCAMSLTLEIIMLALYQQSGDRAGNSAAVFFLFLHIGL